MGKLPAEQAELADLLGPSIDLTLFSPPWTGGASAQYAGHFRQQGAASIAVAP